ncbi:MAG: DNA polymerase I [Planctomycetaceae bacterium]|nr:DNA polymerase I [Planctomycetaceae bacterium]
MADETLYLIDVYNLIFQVFHAIPPMTGPKGQPTNAVFGFTRDLMKLLDKHPSHLVCAMDISGPGVRNDIYEEYKANRSEMPEDLRPQIPLIEEVIEGLNIPAVSCSGWEADDVIATLARRAVEAGMNVCIVTSDKDNRQLIGPKVRMYNARKDTYLDEEGLMKDWGIRPDQVIDYQALTGDSVDNIPGVPLVGPKKAKALIDEFGKLDEILANADQVSGKKLKENLVNFADQARISRELVTLNQDLPLDFDLETARVHEPNREKLLTLFQDLGFRRLTEQMQSELAGEKPQEKIERTWEQIDTATKFQKFLKELRKQKKFCVDLETTSLDARSAEIVGWALSWKIGQGYYLPVQGPTGQKTLDPQEVADALAPLLADPDITIVNQNIKYDMIVMKRIGLDVHGLGVDPMVGDYLLDAGARSHSLNTLAEKYLDHRMIPISDLIGKGKKQKQMFEVDVKKAAEYAAEDADISFELAGIIEQKLKDEDLYDLYWDLERPLIHVLADMEFLGIRVDPDELKQQSEELGGRLEVLMHEIYELAEEEFNIDSPKQLRVILFEKLGLPVQKRTKTGPSTDQEVLETLAAMHELPEKIIEHRQLSKLKGTYLDSLPELINPETGRIHASFNQVVAATGRLSSSDPNLQNIPIRREEGRRIRKAFLPGEDDWQLLCADYSQIELRMLAHFSGDPELVKAYQEGLDIHTAVAAEVFNVEPEEVNKDERRIAKAVNFGVIYGQSPFGLAKALGIPQQDAAEFIDNYFAQFSRVEEFLLELLKDCERKGYAETILGRRREIQGIRQLEGRQRNMPERTAINTVIQGSAADLIKQAMLNVSAKLKESPELGSMLLQIHDELVFECPGDQVETLAALVKEEMESAMELDVPLVVDLAAGPNWYDLETV